MAALKYKLVRQCLNNVEDVAIRWQIEGGVVLQGDKKVGTYSSVKRAAGLSAPKIRALRAIAEAVSGGALPLDSLATSEAEAAHAALTAVKGIGPWTADVYLLFCLGHPDIFPAGDLALQEAARLALRMRKRPDEKKLRKIAARWRPWRGVAAMVLWSHYRIVKGRAGAPLVTKNETRAADAA